MVNDFAAKTALIMGAARRIGRAVARGLADTGAGLILVARRAWAMAVTPANYLGPRNRPGNTGYHGNRRWGGRGSNPRPADYESAALTS